MKKFKYLLLINLIAISLVNAQEIKKSDCECRFKPNDVVMVTWYDQNPSLVGQIGTVLDVCNQNKYHLVNFPAYRGSWEISDDNMGLAQ
jgi:hypothetical protein